MTNELSRIETEIARIIARHEYRAYCNAISTCARLVREAGYDELADSILVKTMIGADTNQDDS